jgi:hypothetical protein
MNLRLYAVAGVLHVDVTLSRRNLRSLLTKLAEPVSLRTLIRDMDNGVRLIVRSDPDYIHYADREAGTLVPATEAKLLLFDDERA